MVTTQKLKLWQNSKTQIVTKLTNSNWDETQKLKLWQNLTVIIVNNNLTHWQPMICSPGSVLRFLPCLPYQCSWGCSTNTFVTDEVSQRSFLKISSKHCLSETVRARELTFIANVDLPPRITCHISLVTCHLSHADLLNVSNITNRVGVKFSGLA